MDNDFNTFIQVTLKAIQRDQSYIRKDMKKIEECIYNDQNRINGLQSTLSYKGWLLCFCSLIQHIIRFRYNRKINVF